MRWLFLCGLALTIFNLVAGHATGSPTFTAIVSAFTSFYLMMRVLPAVKEQEDENFAKKMTALLDRRQM